MTRILRLPASQISGLNLLCRILLAALLIVSGITKFQNPYAFLITLYQYEIFNGWQARLIAASLPILEVSLGICILTGFVGRLASTVSTFLFAVFALALASVVMRGIKTSCGCFGPLETADITWWTVARTTALFLTGVFTVFSYSPETC